MEAPLVLQMAYNAFFVSLVPEEELDEREEDLRLRVHFPSYRYQNDILVKVLVMKTFSTRSMQRRCALLTAFNST